MRIAATWERCGGSSCSSSSTPPVLSRPTAARTAPRAWASRACPLAASADQALAALVRSLREIAGRNPRFRIDPQTVLRPVTEALEAVARRDHEAQGRQAA